MDVCKNGQGIIRGGMYDGMRYIQVYETYPEYVVWIMKNRRNPSVRYCEDKLGFIEFIKEVNEMKQQRRMKTVEVKPKKDDNYIENLRELWES